jgi:HEAT repeats
MTEKLILFFAGLAVGVAGILALNAMTDDEAGIPDGREAARLSTENADLKAGNQELRQTLEREREEFQQDLAAVRREAQQALAEIVPAAPVTPEVPTGADLGRPSEAQIEAAMREFAGSLQGVIMGEGDEAKRKLREFFARVDAADLALVVERYKNESDMEVKIVIAHALAQSGRPEAIEALTDIILDRNRAFTDRRFVAHGLAFTGNPDLHPLLLDVATNDPDRGTRANAAFGLARDGVDEGLKAYAAATDEAFAEQDPAAMQYLSGFYLLGKPALPYIRERLDTYKEPQTRVTLIQLVKKEKDREALPVLTRLVNDPTAGKAVQDAARQAIELITAPEEED